MSAILSSLLEPLLQRSDVWRGDALAHADQAHCSSGFANLDAELPGAGWPCGMLIELMPETQGIGELSLLLPALARHLEGELRIALLNPPWRPQIAAWQAAGIAAERLLTVHAELRHAIWACEQILRCSAVGGLIAWLPQCTPADLRRLHRAAAERRILNFVIRPARHAGEASPAPLRLALAASAAGLAVRIIKRRGPPLLHALEVAVARPVPAVSPGRRPARPIQAVEAKPVPRPPRPVLRVAATQPRPTE